MPRRKDPGNPHKNRVISPKNQEQVDIYEAGRDKAAALRSDMTDYVIELISKDTGWDQWEDIKLPVRSGGTLKRVEFSGQWLVPQCMDPDTLVSYGIALTKKEQIAVHAQQGIDRYPDVVNFGAYATLDEAEDAAAEWDVRFPLSAFHQAREKLLAMSNHDIDVERLDI